MNDYLLSLLVCPYCHNDLRFQKRKDLEYFYCDKCSRKYDFRKGIPNFLPNDIRIEKNVESKKIFGRKWVPGYRGWKPNLAAKIISFSFSHGNGRVKEKIDTKSLVLDVGCGDDYNGNVNVDVYIPTPLPPNFILASAERLPFKDNTFNIVRSAYVIEHCLYPVEFIREQIRVSKNIVKIFTDNSDWLGTIIYRILNTGSIFHDEHYFKWSKEYFSNLINRLGLKGSVKLFNSSPSFFVKFISFFGKLPRIGPIFYRDLFVEIKK